MSESEYRFSKKVIIFNVAIAIVLSLLLYDLIAPFFIEGITILTNGMLVVYLFIFENLFILVMIGLIISPVIMMIRNK